MKSVVKYLKECKDRACYDLFCYSKTYSMDTPKSGFEKEFAVMKRNIEIVNALIEDVETSGFSVVGSKENSNINSDRFISKTTAESIKEGLMTMGENDDEKRPEMLTKNMDITEVNTDCVINNMKELNKRMFDEYVQHMFKNETTAAAHIVHKRIAEMPIAEFKESMSEIVVKAKERALQLKITFLYPIDEQLLVPEK